MSINLVCLLIIVTSLLIWLGMLLFWGRFWQADQRLDAQAVAALAQPEATWPSVCAVIPARNEADVLPISLRSLLTQEYPGLLRVIVVDDHSTDGTAAVALQTAAELGKTEQLQILNAAPLPAGWSGKLWAVAQGVKASQANPNDLPDYLLLTDADIRHGQGNLRTLIAKAEREQLAQVSLMVLLRCESVWEKFLIPAFVFFFQMLYPFAWVNDPTRKTAGAAGGCNLIRTQALNAAGGIAAVREALIDDCALAAAIKRPSHEPGQQQKIWLGLTRTTFSLRPYPSLKSIWDMVARTAFTQLAYSNLLLAGTVLGMTLVYLVPLLAIGWGALRHEWLMAGLGALTWGLMSLAYWPTIRLYQISPLWSFTLPAIALLYNLMTLDSAWQHWRGQGGAWKGRVYAIPGKETAE
jgi:hopene-associated glycosyltransferase HpnB